MKRFTVTVAITALLLTTAVADHHNEKPWLDMQNCEICKHMSKHMDVMQNVTWETHKIESGLLSASVVPKEHRQMVDAIHKNMQASAKLFETGKDMQLCGFCNSHMALKKSGAKEQEINTDFGMVSLLTSDDPDVVKQIHDHAEKTIKEFAAFKEAAAGAHQ
tara:strand:+ start:172619 stop:173104 length:486 start_codon:yes stop_codon:yes gene_type:complete